MQRSIRVLLLVTTVGLAAGSPFAQKIDRKVEIVPPSTYRPIAFENSPQLQSVLNEAIGDVLNSYPIGGFKATDIAATLIDVQNAQDLRWANLNGEKAIYPASVVKMFYMAALERQLEDGKVTSTPELQRGLRDMIVDSSNEATQYILDVITDTSSGAELPQKEFDRWQFKRNRVNRYYSAMGYERINVNQKTFCEDAYGIEQQSRRYKGENRNMLTTNAVARLLAEIVLGRINTPDRTAAMMDLMKRDPFSASNDPDSQATAFTGKALIDRKMVGTKLWSKAGWVTRQRHDAAYIETPDGLKFVLVIFTENHGNDREVIPSVAGKVIDRLRTANRD